MRVIQFIHPGSEVMLAGNPVPWNVQKHGRRLLRHCGEYVDSCDVMHKDLLSFWNEYEALTNATNISTGPLGWEYAKRYHEIIVPAAPYAGAIARGKKCCANTDPCVFGDTFKYSNCQQVPGGDLWDLPSGSMIVFGSVHNNSFYLDTVLVTAGPGVKYSVPFSAASPLSNSVSVNFQNVTLKNLRPIQRKRGGVIQEFMLYRGVRPKKNNGLKSAPYSFTPAKVGDGIGFNQRCRIDLGRINQTIAKKKINGCFSLALNQRHKCVLHNASAQEVAVIWKAICDEVKHAGKGCGQSQSFVRGVRFDWPTNTVSGIKGNGGVK